MGIYLDTLEDNDESSGWRIDIIKQKLGIPALAARKLPSIVCPACTRFFFSQVELNNHLFEEHRHEYIEVNGNIFREHDYINISEIDKLLLIDSDTEIEFLQLRIDRNDRTVDNEWSRHISDPCNSIYTQYKFGFFEYLRAHDLEVNRHSKDFQALSSHFGSAYGKLQPFSTFLAQLVRRVIAFKMNWFKEHTDIPEDSIFFLAWHFFTNTYENVKAINNLPTVNIRQQKGIILDGFHSELLEAIQMYYSKRSELNYNWLCKLEKLVEGIDNPNYLHKLALFKARIYREWDNIDKAQESYRTIRNHPEFKIEAKQFND